MPVLTVTLSEEQIEELRQRSRSTGVPIAEIVRRAVWPIDSPPSLGTDEPGGVEARPLHTQASSVASQRQRDKWLSGVNRTKGSSK